MKLSDFNKKPSKHNRKQPQIIVENLSAIDEYQQQIQGLENKIIVYQNIEVEKDEALKRQIVLEENLTLSKNEISAIEEKLKDSKAKLEYADSLNAKLLHFEQDYKDANGQLSNTSNELDLMTKRAEKQSLEINQLKNNLETQGSTMDIAFQERDRATIGKQDILAEVEELRSKFKEIESFTNETSRINKELVKETKEIKDELVYWQTESKEFGIQLEEAKLLETKLRKWITDLEVETNQNQNSKTTLGKKIIKQQSVISDMTKTLDDMVQEMTYLRIMNSKFREELSKPSYASMGAIMRAEGFTMPQGKDNIRTHNLGYGKPTLLKFKPKEEVSDGR